MKIQRGGREGVREEGKGGGWGRETERWKERGSGRRGRGTGKERGNRDRGSERWDEGERHVEREGARGESG